MVVEFFDILLGLGEEAGDLDALEMGTRAVLIYVVTLTIVRVGKKRFMGRATAFDMIVGIVLGSIVSRAITGNAPMVPAITAAAVVMVTHWAFSALAVRWGWFGKLIKGRNRVIIKDGKIDDDELCDAHMTTRDLLEALREQGVTDVAAVSEARLERDGNVSIIERAREPKIVTVDVAPGTQTVRIEFA